jgi:hypothetical protein
VYVEEAGNGDFVRGDKLARARGQSDRTARPHGFDDTIAKEDRGIGNFCDWSERAGNMKQGCGHGELLS